MKLSVLQWNVLYKERSENILQLIQEINADLVCLQELTQNSEVNPRVNIPAKIEALGYQGFYKATIERPGFVMGNGIFSKYPITQSSVHPTQLSDGSGDYDTETRLYLEVALKIQHTSLRIGTVHLSYTKAFEETLSRAAENQKFLSYVGKHTENFLFCGDFNAQPDSQLIRELGRTFKTACPPFSEPTWTTKPFSHKGFEANTLDWRLDYVFATPDIKVLESHVVKTDFSDHLPILTTIEI